MSYEIDILRSLLRLARRRKSPNPTLADLVGRTGCDESDVRRALFSLARSGLIQRTPAGLRLSLAGLAVAVACAQRPRPIAKATKPAPLERRSSERRRPRRAA